jgi:hypothetical protein
VAWDSYRTATTTSTCGRRLRGRGVRRWRWRPVRGTRRTLRSHTTARDACGWHTKKAAADGAKTSARTGPMAWRSTRGARSAFADLQRTGARSNHRATWARYYREFRGKSRK